MFKEIQLSERSVRPFKVYKNWNIDLYSNSDSLLTTEDGDIILSSLEVPSGSYEITASLATEFQEGLHRIQVSEGEMSPTNLFYDSSSRYYNSESNPINWTGTYKRSVYNLVKEKFYNENRAENFGIETLGRSPNGEYLENRTIFDRITLAKIPQQVFGETIIPGSVTIVDRSYTDNTFVIQDDGLTNLSALNYYSVSDEIFHLNCQYTESYQTTNDSFGHSIDANGGYLIVGSPILKDSFGNNRVGSSDLFKYDLTTQKYRLIKNFYSINSVEQLEHELGDDVLLGVEQSDELLNTEETVDDLFGYSVAVNDEFLVIGAPQGVINEDTSSFQNSGSGLVFVYDRNKGGLDNWGLINAFSGSASSSRFGSDVAIEGDRIVIGDEGLELAYVYSKKTYMSSDECENHPTSSGDPYFVSGNNVWVYEDTLPPPDTLLGFGGTVAIDGDIIVVGSKTEQPNGKAFVYEFQQSGSNCITGSWINTCVLNPSNTFSKEYIGIINRNYSSSFGHSIAINDNIIAIGDPRANTYQAYSQISASIELNPGKNIGSVYIYKYGIEGDTSCFACQQLPTQSMDCLWGFLQTIEGDTDRTNYFGYSLDIDGDNMAVGSPFDISLSASYDSVSQVFSFEKQNFDGLDGVVKIFTLNPEETFYSRSIEIPSVHVDGNVYKIFGGDVSMDNSYTFVSNVPEYYSTQSYFTSSVFLENNLTSNIQGSVHTYRTRNIGQLSHIGNVFYKNGVIVLTTTQSQFENLLDKFEVSFKSQHTIYEEEYILTVNPGEFNVSQNPTSLVEPNLMYDINGDGLVDFEDIDLILRYINKYKIYVNVQINNSSEESDDGFTLEQDLFSLDTELTDTELVNLGIKNCINEESWWNNDVLLMESEDVLINAIEENVVEFFTDPKLSEKYIETLTSLEEGGYLDINGDGVVDAYDASIILRYFNKVRTNNLIEGNITEDSTRTTAGEIRILLDLYTGTNQEDVIHPNFYNYIESSSYDKTGSYLSPYVTSIGLYDDDFNLVGVAKLGSPIKIVQDYPINFIVSWDK